MSNRTSSAQVEHLTHQIGMECFERMAAHRPRPHELAWWQERLLNLCMRNERLKVQAFRFIDVLPTLSDPVDVARHLREYFAQPGPARRAGERPPLSELERDGTNGLVQWVSRGMDFARLDSPRARFFAWAARRGALAMARQFIAGTNLPEAERTIRRMRRKRLAFTIDLLGETALSRPEAEHYHETYLHLIRELPRIAARWPAVAQIDRAGGRPRPRVNISVKLTSIAKMDPIAPEASIAGVKERLRPLLRAGMEGDAHIHIDMEHYEIKDLTLQICREIFLEDEFRDYPHFGLVLQAYLTDTERDAAELVEWAKGRGTPLWVRLVKGAYWDTETVLADQNHWPCPVWREKWQSDACYERITRLLLADHEHIHVAFGSHNIRSLSHALALKQLWRIPADHFELQMLYGMGDPIKTAAVEMGQLVRVYTPYGELLPGMAYFIRRLLENTANESFLRHSSAEDAPREELLANPADNARPDISAFGQRLSKVSTAMSTANGPSADNLPPPNRVADGAPSPLSSDDQVLRWLDGSAATPSGRRSSSNGPRLPRFEFEEPIMDPFQNVPSTDFSREPNRQKMIAALAGWQPRLGREYPLVIGGQRLRTSDWYSSLNPSRPKELIGRVAQADATHTEQAVQAAAEAFKSWRRVSPYERSEFLFRAAEIIEERRFELSALMTLECGKPWREADYDTSEAIDFCNYYGKEMIRMADNVRRRDIPGETNEYYYAPRGVVGVISPWNFPLAILTGMTVAAVVTGNTAIMKPAEPASVTAAMLMEVLEQASLPAGVVNYLPGPGNVVGELLVKHPQVAMIAFTGSRGVGCRINKLAAETLTSQPSLKKVIAEMGGKNAIIVDSDADLDEAIKGTLQSAFGYAGQKCSAASRCIVVEPLYRRFLERLVEAARSITPSPADDAGTSLPPVIDQRAFDSIRRYIEIGKQEARLALGLDAGDLVARTGGYYIGPHIFVDVKPDARIAREEIFGPVLAVFRAATMDEAIAIFNDSDFALTGGIYSRSPANIEKARAELECGNLYINRKITGALVDLQPFGGFKLSGGGKAGGPDYLIQFCEPRTVTENTLRRGFAPSDEAVASVG